MKHFFTRSFLSRGLIIASAGAALSLSARAATPSDIATPEKRRASVESALKLSKAKTVAPLPEELPLPFGAPGFDLSDAQERAAALAASGKAAAPKVASDRDTLEQIATKIPPSGTIFIGDEPRLMFGKKTVKIGTHFTVTLNGQDYDLELVNIDRTTFTLRLNREEITRPIKPAKSQ